MSNLIKELRMAVAEWLVIKAIELMPNCKLKNILMRVMYNNAIDLIQKDKI